MREKLLFLSNELFFAGVFQCKYCVKVCYWLFSSTALLSWKHVASKYFFYTLRYMFMQKEINGSYVFTTANLINNLLMLHSAHVFIFLCKWYFFVVLMIYIYICASFIIM